MRLGARNLTVVHQTASSGAIPALGPVTFEIESGEFVCMVGPSGSGKSTLIHVIAGLQHPTSGEALIDGQLVREPSSSVGLMFQDANLMPWRSVLHNIALPLELAGVDQQARYAAAHEWLQLLSLDEFAQAYPSQLSGGMAQRVALARVLVNKPAALLLDEPFGALDALTREQVSFDLLRAWSKDQQTLLMVTHDIQEAVLLSDRVLVMTPRPGRIAASIPVLLPRPRALDDVYSPAFIETARAVRQALAAG